MDQNEESVLEGTRLRGEAPRCWTSGCARQTWNGLPGEPCCDACSTSGGSEHGSSCNEGVQATLVAGELDVDNRELAEGDYVPPEQAEVNSYSSWLLSSTYAFSQRQIQKAAAPILWVRFLYTLGGHADASQSLLNAATSETPLKLPAIASDLRRSATSLSSMSQDETPRSEPYQSPQGSPASRNVGPHARKDVTQMSSWSWWTRSSAAGVQKSASTGSFASLKQEDSFGLETKDSSTSLCSAASSASGDSSREVLKDLPLQDTGWWKHALSWGSRPRVRMSEPWEGVKLPEGTCGHEQLPASPRRAGRAASQRWRTRSNREEGVSPPARGRSFSHQSERFDAPGSREVRSNSEGVLGDTSTRSKSLGPADDRGRASTFTTDAKRTEQANSAVPTSISSDTTAPSSWMWNPVSWVSSTVETASWLYNDANILLDAMAPKAADKKLPLEEFELGDLLQAGVKFADLACIASEMTLSFWIFLIALVLVLASLLFGIVDLWVSFVVSYLGWFAYVFLFCTVCISWPVFFQYLVRTIIRGFRVATLHECTVQLHGIPPALSTYPSIDEFCKERALPIIAIYVSAGPSMERQRVELMFGSVDEMKKAFTDKILTPHMKIGGAWVRVRPKAGTSSAGVEWLLVLMEYLCESVPARFWPRGIFSCLLSMSLTRTFCDQAMQLAVWLRPRLHYAAHIFGFASALISLCLLFFFVGYHAYIDMAEAREELRNEQRQDRLCEDLLPPSRPRFNSEASGSGGAGVTAARGRSPGPRGQ